MPLNEPPRAPGFRPPPASVGESRTRIAPPRRCARSAISKRSPGASARARTRKPSAAAASDMLVANPIASDLDCMRPIGAAETARRRAEERRSRLRRRAPVRSGPRLSRRHRHRPAAHHRRRLARAPAAPLARRAAARHFRHQARRARSCSKPSARPSRHCKPAADAPAALAPRPSRRAEARQQDRRRSSAKSIRAR